MSMTLMKWRQIKEYVFSDKRGTGRVKRMSL